jgi:aspartokinase
MRSSEMGGDAPIVPIKGITSIDKVSIVNLEGASLIGVPGVAERFMAAMAKANINVLMITQVTVVSVTAVSWPLWLRPTSTSS